MNEMTTLQNIERRIAFHMQGAYANILEVGRCLIEAKESGQVPHGEWEAWVNRVANMNERTAQRLMQAAREVNPESAMAKLSISKIQAILALPEPQREAVAVKAVEENQTLRELQATIDEMRGDLDATRKQATKVAIERDNALAINERIYRERAEAKKECDALREDLEKAKARPGTGISGKAQARIDKLETKLIAADCKVSLLEKEKARLADERDRLTAQLADAEKMAEYQAQQREQAQQQLLDMQTQAARGELPIQEDLTAEAVGVAARTFMGAVGYVPHSTKLVTMRESDRQEIATYAAMLQQWSEDVLRVINNALGAVVIEEV